MSLMSFLTGHADEQQQYQQVRERFGSLMSACFETLSADELLSAARRARIRPVDTLDYHNFEVAVFDVAAFHLRRRDETAVARMLRNLPAETPALDRAIVTSWQQYRWSIFEVTTVRHRMDLTVRDTLDGWTATVRDLSMATEAKPGDRLATRIVPVDDLWLTTGVGVHCTMGMDTLVRNALPPELHDTASWPARGTPARLDLDLRLIVGLYAGPTKPALPTRKGPCPCGSGKKYKHCCGKER